MKSNIKTILLFVVFVVAMFAIQMRMPVAFNWEPSFCHNDSQPFGCMVFDSVMKASLPKGYMVTQRSLSAIAQDMDSTGKVKNVLLVGNDISLSEKDSMAIKNILNMGGKVMLVMTTYDGGKTDSLLLSNFGMMASGQSYFNTTSLTECLEGNDYLNDTVVWREGVGSYPHNTYKFYNALIDSRLTIDDSLNVVTVATSKYLSRNYTLIGTRKYGKGQFILAGTPLLFTNYSVLSKDTRSLVFRMMSLISDKEVVRTEVYCKGVFDEDTYKEKTVLDLILNNEPLLWAWRLMAITLLVFMIFNARRRQKVIPVIERPRNHSLEFVKLIGTLFYHNHNHVDLVCKKFTLFKEDILKKTGLDLDDETIDLEDSVELLSNRTGIGKGDIRSVLVRTLNVVRSKGVEIEAEKMISLIDGMNDIQKVL